ncbi:MAG: rRNA maturation RNase YbeY [Roseburia sp.]|nr:rRNA maturation RNase YbeY [Ruminococcus sp.]MCM1154627.1 rRNA maturation RNase YbeY [Roseburia sp.]MCM1243806.1 rRNA maturation RNase YbeY [Roseburia sp.]
MTSYVENETTRVFSFAIEEVVQKVSETVLEMENCPYEACVNLLVTDNNGIRAYNKEYRQIDQETDVLSFPNLEYEKAGDFSPVESMQADCFDPESGELILGDIIISADRVVSQAKEYGHSELREFAFLTAHSMFHLCGYDHMCEEEAAVMEKKQETVLQKLGYLRES